MGQLQKVVEMLKNYPNEKLFLGAQFRKAKKEERYVSHTSELTAECFDFGVERLRSGISRAIDKVIEDSVVVVTECLGHRTELSVIHFNHLLQLTQS